MARVRLHPLFKHLRGTIKGMVFRLTDHGSISGYLSPDMSRVKWSQPQESQRERMAEAWAYASQVGKDPEIKEIYLQMARRVFDNNRWFNMAASDYCNGNNLLGDRFQWDVWMWRAKQENKRDRKAKRRKTRRK